MREKNIHFFQNSETKTKNTDLKNCSKQDFKHVECSSRMTKVWNFSAAVAGLFSEPDFWSEMSFVFFRLHLLVVQHNVWSPDVVTGYMQLFDSPILVWVPLELVVSPELLYPQVGGHNLVLQILKLRTELVESYNRKVLFPFFGTKYTH